MSHPTASTDVRSAPPVARAAVRAAGLHYVKDAKRGIRRLRAARGFRYVRSDGAPLRDARTLERIGTLAIPPAYEHVWICSDPRGHLQATGIDARGRKQYRYHPAWRLARDAGKFARLVAFGESLPALRRRVARDLSRDGLSQPKVVALVVALLDRTWARIGNREYARDNDSYGLTTLRDDHLRIEGGRAAVLRFRGKGGTPHEIRIEDPRLVDIVRRCRDLPGAALFQYVDAAGVVRPVGAAQVNAYLAHSRRGAGAGFTAKDFRTWGATLHAIATLGATPLPEPASERALKSAVAQAVREVSAALRNTPAVCRRSYIHPLVPVAWMRGELTGWPRGLLARGPRKAEQRALAFLRGLHRGLGAAGMIDGAGADTRH